MENIEATLLHLKEQALEATQRADAAFYQNYLDDQAIAIVPYGVFDKPAIVNQMASPNSSFKSTRIDDTRAMVLTPDSGLVTYKASYATHNDGIDSEFQVFVTTVYARINGEWKGVFYQQTPLQPTKNQP